MNSSHNNDTNATTIEQAAPAEHGHGPQYYINIEGKEYPWSRNTISTEEIASLGGWDATQGVIEIDADNNEITLQPGQVVEIRPGHGFAKKVQWRRGDISQDRIAAEIVLLLKQFPGSEYQPAGQWVRVPGFKLPAGWNREITDVAFQIPTAYPGVPPYGIYVPVGIRYQSTLPNNYQEQAANQPPFGGTWGIFSWTTFDGQWRSAANPIGGSNLVNWVHGFRSRFQEGL